MPVINARRFAAAIRQAMKDLQREAGCYKLNNEPYCVETNAYLEQMATRLESNLQDDCQIHCTNEPSNETKIWQKIETVLFQCPICGNFATDEELARERCSECRQQLTMPSDVK